MFRVQTSNSLLQPQMLYHPLISHFPLYILETISSLKLMARMSAVVPQDQEGNLVKLCPVENSFPIKSFWLLSPTEGEPIIILHLIETCSVISQMGLLRFFKNLKESAEEQIPDRIPVKCMVITFPLYSGGGQSHVHADVRDPLIKQRLTFAAELSGHRVQAIIPDPVAAAAVCLSQISETGATFKNLLVVDVGTRLKVTLVSCEEGKLFANGYASNPLLGGDRIDSVLVERFIHRFSVERKDDPCLQKLRILCENTKESLSTCNETVMGIHNNSEDMEIDCTISRQRFEELLEDTLTACLEGIENLLEDAKIDEEKFESVILAGGSCMIPRMQEMLLQHFNGKVFPSRFGPNVVTTYGAAILGGAAIGVDRQNSTQEFTLLSLGIETGGGVMATLIPRLTRMPAEGEIEFQIKSARSIIFVIKVYEGERPLTIDNYLVGKANFKNNKKNQVFVESFKVCLEVDLTGRITLTAKDVNKTTGLKRSFYFSSQKERLCRHDISKMLGQAHHLEQADEEVKARIKARDRFYGLILKLEQLQTSFKLQIMIQNAIKKACKRFGKSQRLGSIEEYEAELNTLMDL